MTPSELEILPCKCCGAVPIPVKASNRTGIYNIRCMTWGCGNKLTIGGVDYINAVWKWNECMMEGTEDGQVRS